MSIVHQLIQLYVWILILSAILSWFPAADSTSFLAQAKYWVAKLTDPVLVPLRQIMPKPHMGGVSIDFSVWAAIILLDVINGLL